MRRIARLAIVIGAVSAGQGALAERAPRAVPADYRIRTVPFERDNVVMLYGTMGVSTMIVFGEDERIATVAMGDTLAWQAVPDQSKRFLFIKPLDRDAATNMNVVTNKRIYNFVLKPGALSGEKAVYKLRFTYPDEEASARLINQAKDMAAYPNLKGLRWQDMNLDYVYKGREITKPANVFDDGVKTFFFFEGDVPAIFQVNSDMTETLVNYRREGKWIVVDKVAGQWTLRHGDEATCVFNLRGRKEEAPRLAPTDVQPAWQTQHAQSENPFERMFSALAAPAHQ